MSEAWIIGVDPGGTTGYAIYSRETKTVQAHEADPHTFRTWLGHWMTAGRAARTLWAVERYIIRPDTLRKTRQYDPLELIGAVKLVVALAGGRLEMQAASSAKSMVTDTRLRGLGLWVPGKDHARDALRHLVLRRVIERDMSLEVLKSAHR